MLSIIKNSMINFFHKKNNVMVTLDHHITQTISKIKILNILLKHLKFQIKADEMIITSLSYQLPIHYQI